MRQLLEGIQQLLAWQAQLVRQALDQLKQQKGLGATARDPKGKPPGRK